MKQTLFVGWKFAATEFIREQKQKTETEKEKETVTGIVRSQFPEVSLVNNLLFYRRDVMHDVSTIKKMENRKGKKSRRTKNGTVEV